MPILEHRVKRTVLMQDLMATAVAKLLIVVAMLRSQKMRVLILDPVVTAAVRLQMARRDLKMPKPADLMQARMPSAAVNLPMVLANQAPVMETLGRVAKLPEPTILLARPPMDLKRRRMERRVNLPVEAAEVPTLPRVVSAAVKL